MRLVTKQPIWLDGAVLMAVRLARNLPVFWLNRVYIVDARSGPSRGGRRPAPDVVATDPFPDALLHARLRARTAIHG